MDSFLENKIVLYVVAFISGTSLLNLVLLKKVNAIIFFIAVGYLTSFFNKNMIVIMLVSLITTNILIHSRLTVLREGFGRREREPLLRRREHEQAASETKSVSRGGVWRTRPLRRQGFAQGPRFP